MALMSPYAGGLSVRELLGPGASGALRRAYTWLCDEGAIESPSLRWPTQAGVARVEWARGEVA